MRYLTASKPASSSIDSSISLFVALYLILLAFFIILTKDLSFDDYKKSVAMRSLYTTFGKPKTQEIYFGVIDEGKIDNFHIETEKIFEGKAEITVATNGNRFTLNLPKSEVYYSDEVNFKPEILDKIVAFRDVIRRWNERDRPNFIVTIGMNNYEVDKQRLSYFKNNFGEIQFKTGLNLDDSSVFTITIENSEQEK